MFQVVKTFVNAVQLFLGVGFNTSAIDEFNHGPSEITTFLTTLPLSVVCCCSFLHVVCFTARCASTETSKDAKQKHTVVFKCISLLF